MLADVNTKITKPSEYLLQNTNPDSSPVESKHGKKPKI